MDAKAQAEAVMRFGVCIRIAKARAAKIEIGADLEPPFNCSDVEIATAVADARRNLLATGFAVPDAWLVCKVFGLVEFGELDRVYRETVAEKMRLDAGQPEKKKRGRPSVKQRNDAFYDRFLAGDFGDPDEKGTITKMAEELEMDRTTVSKIVSERKPKA